jgi:hypothetical protein
MPLDGIEADLTAGSLVRLEMASPVFGVYVMTLPAVYPTATAPGQADRWLIGRLRSNTPAVSLPATAHLLNAFRYQRLRACANGSYRATAPRCGTTKLGAKPSSAYAWIGQEGVRK